MTSAMEIKIPNSAVLSVLAFGGSSLSDICQVQFYGPANKL